MKDLKGKMRNELDKERKRHRTEIQNMKVRFPTHTIKCVPLYIHSTKCSSHDLRLLTQVHITITYFLNFRSNNFNYFASKLPKAASSQEIREILEF
jgi:hypothetical protein